MSEPGPASITLEMMRASLYSAVVSDALDELGYREQSPRVELRPYSGDGVLVGRAKTTLWASVDEKEARPYELELRAVDECQPDDVFIAAAGGSMVSGVWGELLSTAASSRGCVGAVIDGGVRDVRKIREMGFAVFARGTCVYDSKERQTVVDVDSTVEIDGVRFAAGDLLIADIDGVVVVPRIVEDDAIRAAWAKVHDENLVRDAIRGGMSATDAYRRFGVL
jgi:regulator of RNase E activity RraA